MRSGLAQVRWRKINEDAPLVIDAVSRATGVSPGEICGKGRTIREADARHIAWYVLFRRKHNRHMISKNAGANYKTVVKAVDKIFASRQSPEFAPLLDRVREELGK